MSYLHLAALGLGPVLMVALLFFILSRGRKKAKAAELAVQSSDDATLTSPGDAAEAVSIPPIGQPVKTPSGKPIVEDPQKAYIREQIQMLGKSNPATVAQLIQTWMDEDRRN